MIECMSLASFFFQANVIFTGELAHFIAEYIRFDNWVGSCYCEQIAWYTQAYYSFHQ
jgi:hypothetical protein